MFELGCRIREILGKRNSENPKLWLSPPLERSNFSFTNPDRLIVVDIPILKRYDKLDHRIIRKVAIPDDVPPTHRKLWHLADDGMYERKVWTTKRRSDTRRVEILMKEPLLRPYVIPHVKKTSGILFDMSYDYYYQLCRKMNPLADDYPKVPDHIFPHWWRSQRACQLASEYKYTLHELISFFEWKDLETAQLYARLSGELADKADRALTTWRDKPLDIEEIIKSAPKQKLKEKLITQPTERIKTKRKQKKKKKIPEKTSKSSEKSIREKLKLLEEKRKRGELE